MPNLGPPGRLRAWAHAARPRTLAAAATPVLVGSAYAWRDEAFEPMAAAAALAGALLIQVGTNYANDYHDHARGADALGRLGPPRATAMGWLSPPRVLAAALVCYGLAAAVGLFLTWRGGWPVAAIGVASLVAGYAYTGGPWPLGYHGLGDAFVLVFFGFVATAGTYYVQALAPPPAELYAAAAGVGALATAILVVNNLRDIETDRRAGKRTLAVRIGPDATRVEYVALLGAAYAIPTLLVGARQAATPLLLPLLSLPLAFLLAWGLVKTRDPRRLNPLLVRTAQLLALYGILLSAGVVLP